jgi:hypothetical protein
MWLYRRSSVCTRSSELSHRDKYATSTGGAAGPPVISVRMMGEAGRSRPTIALQMLLGPRSACGKARPSRGSGCEDFGMTARRSA